MPTKARRQNCLKSYSRPGKQFEIAVSGNVVAITRALPSKAALARVGGAGLDHIVEAQGAWIIRSFLEESLTGYIPAFPPATQSAAMAMGRNATVHVFCWRHKAPAPQHS